MKKKILLLLSFLLIACLTIGCSAPKPIEVELATNEEMEIGTDPLSYINAKEENVEITYVIKNTEGEEVEIDSLIPGDYTIVYTLGVKDDEKRSLTVEKTVKMQDTTAPAIEGIDDVLAIAVNGDVDLQKVLVTDNSDKDVKYVANLENYNPKKAGEYIIVLTAEDKYGNKVEKKITVKVVEEEKLEEAKAEAKKETKKVQEEKKVQATPTPEISYEEVKATPTPKPTEKPATGGNTGGNEIKPTPTPKPTENTKPTPTPTVKPTPTPKPTATPTSKPDACANSDTPVVFGGKGGTIMVGGYANTAAQGGFDGLGNTLSAGQISVSGSVNVNSPGTYTVTYSYTNSCGKTGTASSTWIVKEVPKPDPTPKPNPGCQTGSWNGEVCVCSGGYTGSLCEIAPPPVYACPGGWDKNQPCDALVNGSPSFGDIGACEADRAANGLSIPCSPVTNNGGAVIGYS